MGLATGGVGAGPILAWNGLGGAIPRAAVGGKRRVEGKGGKASASAGGRNRRTGNKVDD
jgi:hypothetical protein